MRFRSPYFAALAALLCWCGAAPSVRGQGIVSPAVGPVNISMGGAAAAAPLDAVSALHWNPASISGLSGSEIVVAGQLHAATSRIGATAPAGAFPSGGPSVALSGLAESHPGTQLSPAVALVYRPDFSLWTYGLGIYQVGGYQTNYQSDPLHPLFSSDGLNYGSLFSKVTFLQVAPTVALQLTERMSIGFAPTMTVVDMSMGPALFAAPDDADGDGRSHFPSVAFSPSRYGLGFQTGVYITTFSRWDFGFSFKSKQWIEEFAFRTVDERNEPRMVHASVEYPMIVSLGTAYRGLDRLLIAADVRYINYADTSLFGNAAAFRDDGAIAGFGWGDTVTSAVGCQYQWSDSLVVRAGYSHSQSQIADGDIWANVHNGVFWNHGVSMGATVHLAHNLSLTAAYQKIFDRSFSGPLRTSDGIVPGAEVTLAQRSDTLSTGISVQY